MSGLIEACLVILGDLSKEPAAVAGQIEQLARWIACQDFPLAIYGGVCFEIAMALQKAVKDDASKDDH